jgi:hypothetical protein
METVSKSGDRPATELEEAKPTPEMVEAGVNAVFE